MSWQDILKIDDEREALEEEAFEKANSILSALMSGIEIIEEQSFTPEEIGYNDEEIEELRNKFVSAEVYDTHFGRVSFTISVNGEVLDGYFDGRLISIAEANKKNKEMKEEEQRSLDNYNPDEPLWETEGDHYYN